MTPQKDRPVQQFADNSVILATPWNTIDLKNYLSKITTPHISSLLFLVGIAFVLLPVAVMAQERDTTRQELDLEQQEQSPNMLQPEQFDRPASGGIMNEMGSYQVPEETEYYQPPFKGQEYLDMAVEAYQEELEKQIGPDWLSRFMRAVSPFINNQFEFGFYQIYDLPVVERDNPLFQSYTDDEEKE